MPSDRLSFGGLIFYTYSMDHPLVLITKFRWAAGAAALAAIFGIRPVLASTARPRATKGSGPTASPVNPYRDFRSTCIGAFARSSGSDGESAGREICGCAARESIHQGVTRRALRRETERIREDPSSPIQDKALLAAFQYCTVISMERADRESQEREREAAKPRPGGG